VRLIRQSTVQGARLPVHHECESIFFLKIGYILFRAAHINKITIDYVSLLLVAYLHSSNFTCIWSTN